jgi:hypothetical protein
MYFSYVGLFRFLFLDQLLIGVYDLMISNSISLELSLSLYSVDYPVSHNLGIADSLKKP